LTTFFNLGALLLLHFFEERYIVAGLSAVAVKG
jgi:hypothetical protein